jgi:hypothetical protein
MLWPAAIFAAVTPYPPYPGALPSVAYQVAVDGQPVFVHNFLTYDQFNWMDHASFAMTGKVHVAVTNLVSERKLMTCQVRPLAYGIQPRISGNTCSFDLDRPRYLVIFLNEEPIFHSAGLMLFAEPPEKNPSKLGDPNVVNIMDYKVDNTGENQSGHQRGLRQARGRRALLPGGHLPHGHSAGEEQRQGLRRCRRGDSGVHQECGLSHGAYACRGKAA